MPIYDRTFSPEEVCGCGRKKNEVHCTECGSTNVISAAREAKQVRVGDIPLTARGWKCRRCSMKFTDADRLRCSANPVQMSVKVQRTLDAVQELPYDERVRLAMDALSSKGTNPIQEVERLAKERVRKPSRIFEIGDDRGMIEQAIRDSGVTIEEVKSSVSLDKEDGETQVCEEKP